MKTVVVGMISRDNVINDANSFMKSYSGSVWATYDDWYPETYIFVVSENPTTIPDDAPINIVCGELGVGAKTWREYLDMIEGDEILLGVMREYPSLKFYIEDEKIFDVDEILLFKYVYPYDKW